MAISRIQGLNVSPATSGSTYNFGSGVTAGNLLIVACSSDGSSAFSLAANGNTWVSSTFQTFIGGVSDSFQIFYCLSAAGGTTAIQITDTGGGVGGLSFTAIEIGSGLIWSVDSVLTAPVFSSQAGGASTAVSAAFSTGDSNSYIYSAIASGSSQTVTAQAIGALTTTLINNNASHMDAQSEAVATTAQSSITSTFTGSFWNATGIFNAAFTGTESYQPFRRNYLSLLVQ
jgi:hypothetical protein